MRNILPDQATGLRTLFCLRERIILNVAGDGAVDVTLNLAAALSRIGQRVLVLDASKGEAAAALGLKARYELAHVLDGDRPLADALLAGPAGISVLPARRGLARLGEGGRNWHEEVERSLGSRAAAFNVWLVSGLPHGASAGVSPVLLVLAPSADALTAAYAQIKSLAREQGRREFGIVVRRAPSESAAMAAYRNVADAARRFLATRLDYCGYIPRCDGDPLADSRSPSGHAFARLAESILSGTNSPLPGALAA